MNGGLTTAPDAPLGTGDGAMRVVETHAGADPRWDRFVRSHPDGSGYLHSGWLAALRREVGQPQVHLVCEDESGGVVGVLPVVATRGLPFGVAGRLGARRWASLPRTPVGGPLATSAAAARSLVTAAVVLADAGGKALQLKRADRQLDGLVDDVVAAPWRTGYVLELPPDPERIPFRNGRTRRRIAWSVANAARRGVTIRRGDRRDLAAWYHLYLRTMRHHAVPARSPRFFDALLDGSCPADLLLAEQRSAAGTRVIAGSIFLRHGPTVSYAFNGVDRTALDLRPNDLVQWHAIHAAIDEGYRRFDFGEVAAGSDGLAEFKRKWGSAEVPLVHYCHPAAAERSGGDPSEPGALGSLARRQWCHVPLAVTRLVGAGINGRL